MLKTSFKNGMLQGILHEFSINILKRYLLGVMLCTKVNLEVKHA